MSAVVVWGMIPLAVFVGMPSTGCLCANGQFKLFCGHRNQSAAVLIGSAHAGCCAAHHADEADCDCCLAPKAAEHQADCCQHGAGLPGEGMQSRTCCQPVFNPVSMSPVAVSAPCDDLLILTVCLIETGAIAYPAVAAEVGEFDTGPPLDRVVAYRHLLI
ncbi:MAG TPA: hypothetical protein VJ783_27000 [Pirellulales bacterium]|nr:hypothetical protein [Pirellulales bacterium]